MNIWELLLEFAYRARPGWVVLIGGWGVRFFVGSYLPCLYQVGIEKHWAWSQAFMFLIILTGFIEFWKFKRKQGTDEFDDYRPWFNRLTFWALTGWLLLFCAS